jgi:glycosyltransferase involved in cell wall biosynthesis
MNNSQIKNYPFFTILTSSLNNHASIKRTQESIKNQTFQNLEHIVIDGGSTDGTIDILKKMEDTYNMSWLSETDQGIAQALNKGLRKAKGQYIIVIQADDRFLNENILEQVFQLLNKEEFDVISFPIILDHPVKGKVLRKPIQCLWWNHFKFIFLHQGCFVNRSVFERIGIFREEFKIAFDYDFLYRALKNKCSVRFEKLPVALMGGEGVGSNPDYIVERIKEEKLVQRLNEQNKFWRMAQHVFTLFYMPYKTKLRYRFSHSKKE